MKQKKKMPHRLKHNIVVWVIYTIMFYIALIPFKIWIPAIGLALILGWFGGILNDIILQLRMLNGEKFPEFDEDKPDELIKS